MAVFTQGRMYDMLSEINRKPKPIYKIGGITDTDCPFGYTLVNGECVPSNYDTNVANENTDFLKSMANSPLFVERYARMVGKPVEGIGEEAEAYKQQMIQNLQTVGMGDSSNPPESYESLNAAAYYKPPYQMEEYNSKMTDIQKMIDSLPNKGKYNKELRSKYQSFLDDYKNQADELSDVGHKLYFKDWDQANDLHERSHASTKGRAGIESAYDYNYRDMSKPRSDSFSDNLENTIWSSHYPKEDPKSGGEKYYTELTELKARKDVAAKKLQELGLYDPINENFTEEHYKKLVDLMKNPDLDNDTKMQIRDIVTPFTQGDTIKMFNDIVQNDSDSDIQYGKHGGQMPRYAPGGESSDGPGDSKKKPPRDSNRILPRWMSDDAIRAIQNTEVGINPYMSNMQSMPEGMLTGEGSKNYSVSRPFYGVTTETGLGKRKINKSDSKGWSLGTYVGKPYDDSSGDAYGKAIEDAGQEAHDMKWDEYNQNLADYEAGTMSSSMLYGEDGWDPEKNKPKYDGKKLTALGRAMQKSPLVGGLSFNYQHPIIKQPNGYNAGGKGKISLDFDPNNQVGVGLEGGIDFYGGSKRKDYRPGQSKWSINPKLMVSLGTRPVYGAGITAGIEGLPEFMPKNFPGYFHANANYSQSFVLPTPTFSANAGINFPLTDLRKRRAQSRVIQKEEEDGVRNTTYEYGGNVKNEKVTLLNKFFRQ